MKFSLVLPFVKKYGLWILPPIIWTLFVQGTFYAVQNSQAQSLTRSIHGQLRQELAVSNFHFLSRNLMDLESSKTMKCIRLTLKGEKTTSILNTSYRGKCEENSFLLQGANVKTELKSINGDLFELEFISLNSPSFFLALWFIRIVGILQIFSFFLYQKVKQEKNRAVLELEQKHAQKLMEIATQVSHDIRSPLSALSMLIGTLKDLPDDKKALVLHATQRINDIANNLLKKNSRTKNEAIVATEKDSRLGPLNLSIEYIPQIIEMMISEKRLQFQNYSNALIDSDFSESFGSFAKIDKIEFARALSNLVNNAVEALRDHQGRVTIRVKHILKEDMNCIEISIKDNGRGIPEKILKRLGEKGVSFGKNGTQSGSGLGVYHAKSTFAALGGNLLIESQEGIGTSTIATLPCVEPPGWFAQEINLQGKKYLVSLDDDLNMHRLWVEKIINNSPIPIQHIALTLGEDLESYINRNINQLKETLFLIDYDLQNRNGLQIIEDLVIEKYALLVTSHAYEHSVQAQATRRSLKILPKSLSTLIPVKF